MHVVQAPDPHPDPCHLRARRRVISIASTIDVQSPSSCIFMILFHCDDLDPDIHFGQGP